MIRLLKRILVLPLVLLLSGCKMALLDPKGIIAASEKQLLVDAVLLMLIVVVPVIILSFVFAWRYRASNPNVNYRPEWSHSTALEFVCWLIPCIIIGILAALTWVSTHKLDPYRPIASKKDTMVVQAVALNWRWLFIYPKQHIATMNYLRLPVGVPVQFQITADAPMNSLQIPQLAGQIYAMPGMRTKLHLIAQAPGNYYGFSANFSGDGFSKMHFNVKATSKKAFAKWVRHIQHSPQSLSVARYKALAKPSEDATTMDFSHVRKGLFSEIVMKYMKPNALLAEKQ